MDVQAGIPKQVTDHRTRAWPTDTFDLADETAIGHARWTFKTAWALHAASNYRRIVPEAHYRHIARNPASLPDDVHIAGKTWPVSYRSSFVQSPSLFECTFLAIQGDRIGIAGETTPGDSNVEWLHIPEVTIIASIHKDTTHTQEQ